MRNRNPQNLKLGIFTVVGLVLFVAAVYFIGQRQNMFGSTAAVISVFKNVNGLQKGNNVRYAGVNIGTVKEITILNDTSIAVNMLVDDKAMGLIKANATAAIGSDGLVGSMVINIIPGGPGSDKKVKSGDTIRSVSQVATADMIATLSRTNENAALLTADLLKITNSINKGEGTIGALIKDEQVSEDFKQSIRNLRRSSETAAIAIERLNRIISSMNTDTSVAGVFLNDTMAANDIREVISHLNTSSNEIKEMSQRLNDYTEELTNGKGAINFIANDTSFVNNLETTLENAASASKKLDENMEALKHNFLFRGYFRRLERQKARDEKH